MEKPLKGVTKVLHRIRLNKGPIEDDTLETVAQADGVTEDWLSKTDETAEELYFLAPVQYRGCAHFC